MSSFDTYSDGLILKEFPMLDLLDRLSSSYSDLVSQIRTELFRFRVGSDEAAFAQNHVLCERINSACGWKLPSHELKLMLDRINWIKHDETFEWMTCEYTAVELYRGRLNWNKEQQEERLEAARNALDCESCMLILFDSFVLMTSSPRSFMYWSHRANFDWGNRFRIGGYCLQSSKASVSSCSLAFLYIPSLIHLTWTGSTW